MHKVCIDLTSHTNNTSFQIHHIGCHLINFEIFRGAFQRHLPGGDCHFVDFSFEPGDGGSTHVGDLVVGERGGMISGGDDSVLSKVIRTFVYIKERTRVF